MMQDTQTVLITGASSGIGRAMAYEFASQKYNLILVARSLDTLNEIAKDISTKFDVQVNAVGLDLSVVGAAQELYKKTQDLGLSIDILVNNAGFGKWGEFNEYSYEEYAKLLQLNISFLTETCHLWLPEMKKKDNGGIINVASSAALIPVPYAAVYSATKSYVLNFSEALYGELLNSNVTVTCLCPSGTKTQFASVANESIVVDERRYESPEHVAKLAIKGFLEQKNYVLSGKQKFLVSMLPRLLSRKSVIKASGSAFKKVVETTRRKT